MGVNPRGGLKNGVIGYVFESLFNKETLFLFYQKVTPTQIFSCEICEIFKNTYFERHLRKTSSKLLFQERPQWLIKIKVFDVINMFHKHRNSRPQLFCKNDVFKSLTNVQESNCVGVSL